MRRKNALRNMLFGVMLKVYQIIVPFFLRTALIYFMGMEYVGLNSLFTSILQVLNLAELGVGSAMIFSIYKPLAENNTEKICALTALYRKYYRIIGGIIDKGRYSRKYQYICAVLAEFGCNGAFILAVCI